MKTVSHDARLAKVSQIQSHGKSYTQIWMPREVGEKLTKGTTYDVSVRDDGSLVLELAQKDVKPAPAPKVEKKAVKPAAKKPGVVKRVTKAEREKLLASKEARAARRAAKAAQAGPMAGQD